MTNNIKVKKFPCENCITLAACLGNDPLLRYSGTALRGHVEALCRKCALINEYIYSGQIVGSNSRYTETVDFYRKILDSKGA